MYAVERQQQIAAAARHDGRVEVTALAENLGVTAETIRRDLAALESRGLVRRVHGGALPATPLGFEPAVQRRESSNLAQKRRIADLAVTIVDDGVRSVIIDAGTTTSQFAAALVRSLPPQRQLTVVTNSLPVATVVSEHPGVHLHLLGGRVRSRTGAAVGPALAAQISQITVDLAFLGANGVHPQRGVTTPDDDEAQAKRLMAASGGSVVVLADSSKVGHTHLFHVADLDDVQALITDDAIDDDALAQLRASGTEVLLA